jgi:hypothetical protein
MQEDIIMISIEWSPMGTGVCAPANLAGQFVF